MYLDRFPDRHEVQIMTHEHGGGPSPEEGPGSGARPGPPGPDADRQRDGTDVDATFAQIVAQFAEENSPVGPWSAAEDVSEEPTDTAPSTEPDEDSATSGSDGAGNRAFSLSPADDERSDGSGTPDEDTFVPPDPPLPSGDVLGRLAWLGIIAGPLALVVAVVLGRQVTTLFLTASLGSFVAGIITLVARLPADRPDDGDDGAVL
jgi:hypothetical protein